jgi:GTP diphosphokinase / guanosine-3',5'-bis(diphosphate) 3'-diphosphatase
MLLEEAKTKLEQELNEAFRIHQRGSQDQELILRAFRFAFEKHKNQKRKSDEPYIVHPTAVAISLIELHSDAATVTAGLLHDVLEDTQTSKEEMIQEFGEEIYELVEGVTKLGKLNFKSSEQAQANNFRKMLMAIAKDMRVVLVKLADRLNNMQTLHYLAEEKRERIARETLDIFAPLANRFGLHSVKTELEDLSFKYLYPEEYQKVKAIIKSKKAERQAQLKLVKERIKNILKNNAIEAEIQGRAKHLYSVFSKLRDPLTNKVSEIEDHEIYDLLGIRILVKDVKDCYTALGMIHENFRPMPGRFKDYIAVPKTNLYQSLHTTVITPYGKPLEVQIRTFEMHDIAENGIAAHWNYKESGGSNPAQNKELEELTWIRHLITWQTDLDDAQEYLDTIKKDILSQEVYILTPKGDVFTLPVDSTPIDFAYRIHSKIGDTCTGAKVNDHIVPINYKLQNGDLVEIITSKNAHPNLSWLNFVKTNQAKHKIKSWYKLQNRDRHIMLGRQMLEERFPKEGFESFIKSEELEAVANKLNYKTTDDLIASIGSGDTSVAQVQGKLQGTKYGHEEKSSIHDISKMKPRRAATKGEEAEIPQLDGLLYNIAKCCMPIPGEQVMGVVSKGKGITVHRSNCFNLKQVEQERLMQIAWTSTCTKTYPTHILIEVVDRVGVVKDILTLVADAGINISDFKVRERPRENVALLRMILNVEGQEHLNKILTSINNMTDVLSTQRV